VTLNAVNTGVETVAERLVREDLPLAVYREVAAHLRQVEGITVVLEPQRSPEFSYRRSQVGAMVIGYPKDLPGGDRQKIEAILDFYSSRHGAWQRELRD
jgi:hypothetical protein